MYGWLMAAFIVYAVAAGGFLAGVMFRDIEADRARGEKWSGWDVAWVVTFAFEVGWLLAPVYLTLRPAARVKA
jgi:hypothetical protein